MMGQDTKKLATQDREKWEKLEPLWKTPGDE